MKNKYPSMTRLLPRHYYTATGEDLWMSRFGASSDRHARLELARFFRGRVPKGTTLWRLGGEAEDTQICVF